MKSLQIIQTIAKIGQVISKIVFVCCIVGFCLCIVGIVSLALGAPVLKIGGVTLQSMLQTNTDMTTGTLYASMATGAIFCLGEGILARFASRYFGKELADGTPFTADGAGELLRLGILSIGIPIAIQIAAQIVQTILTKVLADVAPLDADPAVSVTAGALVLLMALLCKYGADLTAEKAPEEEQV